MKTAAVALLRKERPYLIAILLLATGLVWAVLAASGFESVFLWTSYGWVKDTLWLYLPLCVLLGVLAGLRERLTRTSEFLLQRPLQPELPVFVRGIAGGGLTFVAPFLAAGNVYLADRLGPGDGLGARAGTIGLLGVVAAYSVAAFEAGVLAFALGASWAALATWVFLGMLLFGLHVGLDALDASLAQRALAALALAGLELFGAVRLAGQRADPDRPVAQRWLGVPLVLAALGAAIVGNLGIGAWQHHIYGLLARAQPGIGLAPSGELVLTRYDWRTGRWDILDASGAGVGELDDDQPRINSPLPKSFEASRLVAHFLRTDRYADASMYQDRWTRTLAFDRESRRLQVIDVERFSPDGAVRRIFELRPKVGPPFSADLVFLEARDHDFRERRTVVVIDPLGQRIWRVTSQTPPLFEPLPLPRGESPLGLETVWIGQGSDDWSAEETLTSENSRWRLLGEEWSEVLEFKPATTGRISIREQSTDVLRPRLIVEAPDGRTLEHAYPLDTPTRKLQASLLGLLSVLRPPLLALGASLAEPLPIVEDPARANPRSFGFQRSQGAPVARENARLFFVDRLLSADYRWLLALNLALHAVLAALVARALAHCGAGRARIIAWCAALFIAGGWITPLLALVETRRAWKQSRSGPASAPLVSAA